MWPTLVSLWLALSGQAPPRPAPRRRPAFRRPSSRPSLETLEDRVTPSAYSLSTLGSFFAPNGAGPQAGLIMDSSGNLYGTAQSGGASGDGTVFELAHGSGTLTTLASFNGTNGSAPMGSLIMDSSGNLYGTASGGGALGEGTVFELAQGSGSITTLASFNGTNGQKPECALIMDSSGNLYGTTYQGGASSDGTVFELAQGSGTITTLASFNGTNGAGPVAGLIMDSSGNLYGTTYEGPGLGDGTVFELAQGSGTITTLASFNNTNGLYPEGALLMDSSGNLYGTTFGGGASYHGSVFELAQGSGTLTTLASFNGTNGANPSAALIMDSSGNLYGTTYRGGASSDGTVFELAQGSGTITTLASFNGTNGLWPDCALIMDSSGNLYGTTGPGPGDGTVFELPQGSGTITTLASFSAPNGQNPSAGLMVDSNGNLYGTTWNGGASSDGTAFEMALGSGTITTLASFNGSNGQGPGGTLIMDSSGNLYGTTTGEGASNDGTVFELAHGSGTITTLASFNGTNGRYPLAALIMDSSGNLYGTTTFGGVGYNGSNGTGDGTVFELAHGSGTIATLASFNGTNGSNPWAGLIMDSSGNLYGTTASGGACGYGSVFELAHGSGTITTLASFLVSGTNGWNPQCALIMDSSGNLYGTTNEAGASGGGTVFELAHGSGTLTTLASFNAFPGYHEPGLIMDSSGNLYGATENTVFELAHGSGTIATLASFNGNNVASPYGSPIMDSSGNLYGTTWNGGAGGEGTVFVLTKGPWFAITGPSGVTAGTAGTFTLTALNANGLLNTGYSGAVHITSSDPKAVLPANLTISGGTGTFNVTLKTAGPQSITATDVNNPSMTGFDTTLTISPAAASQFIFSGPSSVKSGAKFSLTLTVEDAYGNVVTGYTGTVHFTSSDNTAMLPANYTFTSSDTGVHIPSPLENRLK